MVSLLDLSLLEVAALYRKKEASPVEVATKTFERLQKLEPQLNAFITIMEEAALSRARQSEKRFLQNESLHLLEGIPYAAKDLFYKKDSLTTCASRIMKDFMPGYSATVLSKLFHNGAILIGKNNMLEFAYGVVHPDYGQTNNPWDITKTSGGSSSGSVAAVASGIGYFSLGSDTGGSIRIPASYCGAVGLKPTRGLVSTYGVFPLSWSLDHAGPITRNVKDAAIVLDTIAGYDSKDPHSKSGNITAFDMDRFEQSQPKRVGVLPDNRLTSLEPDVQKVYEQTLNAMRSLGWELVEFEVQDWNRTEEIVLKVLLPEAAHIHRKWIHRKDDYAEMTYRQIEAGMKQKAVDYLEGLKDLRRYTDAVSTLFEEVDVILTPTVAFPAPAEDPEIGSEEMDEMMFTGPFNISGHPAVSLNMGFTRDGLPVGMQLVGPHFGDMELLQTAYQLEKMQEKTLPLILVGLQEQNE
ncbi:aspartyl-tRNA(Asn)/glutamyl-tRNA(Gln) amidotransferase subunit A [Planomicrobium soli]|uniref:Aspartyl-tRNA(Asn)/glutamyl-tRNA(Gln) amidotransferase subunit A n=1 Tax=Planomicrobium soli TaxID=1176648 RepID=A0A2P8H565_9BACL|nr:amidase [Planomicrobium soli]PSL41339.1 aspartyl-tRNA(Asn)/glutamyl-tRNA(Gln) amidotransferase subunit A [Planomicrobium soli]